jgi:FecR protein
MYNMSNKRRAWLKRVAALSALSGAGISGLIQDVLAKGDLPAENGITSLSGNVTVNGVRAKVGTILKSGDRIATADEKGTYAIVVVGRDAYLMRENTSVIFQESKDKPGTIETILLKTGKLLSVFAKRPNGEQVNIRAQSATIGIRGTGCYIEIYPKRTYFCLCYGEATIEGPGMSKPTTYTTIHHDKPVWLDESSDAMRVESTKFGSHTDDELIMLEKLTGREPPFVAMGLTGKY